MPHTGSSPVHDKNWSVTFASSFSLGVAGAINALNLEPTTSLSLMKTTLTNNAASNHTVDNLKFKKLS